METRRKSNAEPAVYDLTKTEHHKVWKIQDVGDLINDQVEFIETSFSCRDAPIEEWNCLINVGPKEKEFLSFEISGHKKCNPKIHLEANISILNHRSEKQFILFFQSETGLGKKHVKLFRPDFICKSFLLRNTDTFLSKNILTVVIDLLQSEISETSLKNDTLSSASNSKRRKLSANIPDSAQRVDIFSEDKCRLVQDYSDLFERPVFTDAVLKVSGSTFKVHKAIISSRSSVFKTIFNSQSNSKKQKENHIEIKDISPDIFGEFLRYIYCGQVENIEQIAADLIIVADKYELDRLKSTCEETMSEVLNAKNALEFLRITEQLKMQGLKQKILQFIKTNHADVFKESKLEAKDFMNEMFQILIPE